MLVLPPLSHRERGRGEVRGSTTSEKEFAMDDDDTGDANPGEDA